MLERPCSPGAPRDPRDRWGRLLVSRATHTGPDGTRRGELHLRVLTFAGRGFTQRRLGSAPRDQYPQPSASMDLGEAVQTAVDRGLPLLLSSEAAEHLGDQVRVGRMKGRPGMLTITTADGLSATTRRVVAEQAIAELRALKAAGAPVVLDAGARQVLRMVRARPLADDPVLLGRQRERRRAEGRRLRRRRLGHRRRQDVTSGRALAHRATATRRLRALVVAEGRLLGQWRDELTLGAPGRGLPALAPNVDVLVLDDQRPDRGADPRLRPRARRPGRRRAVPQRRARPLPRPARGDRLAPADRRRGAALRQPRHPRPPGAQARPAQLAPPTAGC